VLNRMFAGVLPDVHSARSHNPVTAIVGLAALIPLVLASALAPAHADGMITSSCVRGAGSSSCVTIWRTGLGGSAGPSLWTPRAEREAAEAAEREARWVARCRPSVRQDQYGVPRYRYAAPGCEYGKYE
jgi:hypothetical protein